MFKYRGKSSKDFHLKIGEGRALYSAEQDITFEEVAGIDGELAIDNQRLKSVPLPIPCELVLPPDKSIDTATQEIVGWLRGEVGWHDLELGTDPKYVRRAMHYEQYDVEKVFKQYGRSVLNFKCKPVKYLKSALQPIVITKGQQLNNTENTVAKPLMVVTGSGNITINIGKSKLSLVGVDKGIIVDSQSKSVTSLDGQRPLWSQMIDLGGWPEINKGVQKIDWTGNVTGISMIQRLGAKV
ncbi:hypothetical protein [Enterococcus rotai]|uniref:hypothetical protein n=1 Tax=Enterococcus rotai TaxID=118060 RepID=UPI0035C77CF7